MAEEYGWRGRIGILVPLVKGSITHSEFRQLGIEGVEMHVARLQWAAQVTVEELAKLDADIDRASTEAAGQGVDIIVYGCTASSIIHGLDYDKEIIRRIETTTGIKATTIITSVLKAMELLQMRNVVLVTPYPEDVTLKQVRFLEGHGFEVANHRSGNVVDPNQEYKVLPTHELYRFVKEAFVPGVDGVFISSGNLMVFDIIERLEVDLGVPVVTSNLAASWNALRLIGVNEKVSGFGRLLGEH